MAPRVADSRCNTSAHGASSFSARRTDSNWPITFLVLFTRSNFSLDKCDIFVDYPVGVWYQRLVLLSNIVPSREVIWT